MENEDIPILEIVYPHSHIIPAIKQPKTGDVGKFLF